MSGYLAWAAVLLCQNAAWTWVSRARNSASLRYHAVASVCSNGVYILSLGASVRYVAQAPDRWHFAFAAAFYVAFTTLGAVVAHHVLQSRVEAGTRKVGAG